MKSILELRTDLLPLLKPYSCVRDALTDFLGLLTLEIANGLSVSDMSYEICQIAAELTPHPMHMNANDVMTLIRSDIKELSDDDAFMYVSLLYDSSSPNNYYGGAEKMAKSYLTFPDYSYAAWVNTNSSKNRFKENLPNWEWHVSSKGESIHQLLEKTKLDPLVIDLVLCASDELKRGDLFTAFEKYTRIKERTEYYKATLHAINLCVLYITVANKRIPYLSPCITPKGLKLLYTTDKEPKELYAGEYKANLSEMEADPPSREYKKLCYKYISRDVRSLNDPSDIDLNDLPFTEPLVSPVTPGYTADGPIPKKRIL